VRAKNSDFLNLNLIFLVGFFSRLIFVSFWYSEKYSFLSFFYNLFVSKFWLFRVEQKSLKIAVSSVLVRNFLLENLVYSEWSKKNRQKLQLVLFLFEIFCSRISPIQGEFKNHALSTVIFRIFWLVNFVYSE
jgi:hypothetical protein